MDSSESELGILDLIQVFVETLDKCFENVCELDLIFHMDKVHYILNELVMGGMVLETNMTEILTRVEEQNKIEKEEVCWTWSSYILLLKKSSIYIQNFISLLFHNFSFCFIINYLPVAFGEGYVSVSIHWKILKHVEGKDMISTVECRVYN